MKRARWALIGFVGGIGAVVAALLAALLVGGVSARPSPSALETFVARHARHLAIPRVARERTNPIPATPEVIVAGRAHWADHCAACHGNDGSGDTPLGRGLYPNAPDMRLAATQGLTDGELLYIIENGVRFTGMPAWGGDSASASEESWHLVRFIRHLPDLSAAELAEMAALNPKTPAQLADEEETRRFLEDASESNTADRTNAELPPSKDAR